MVFYGRRSFVDILDCYLKANLVRNGGYLTEVWFLENTDVVEDKDYLAQLVAGELSYVRIEINQEPGQFDSMWHQPSFDNGTMYLKIDDDIVYIHPDAIPQMVHTLMKHPEAHDVAANIVNSPFTNWLHYHNDAVHPYLPDIHYHPTLDAIDWRPSKLPVFPLEDAPNLDDWWSADIRPEGWDTGFAIGSPGGPPSHGHRWLPLPPSSAALMKTPITQASFDAWGSGLFHWTIAAQQQYALFQNIENNTMHKYHFGNVEGVWNQQYERYNLNFLAIWGRSLNDRLPGGDDEADLTRNIPLQLKKHTALLIQSKAIVAHFNFGPQPEIKHTDLLDRYRGYANEFVCRPDNQKPQSVV